MIDFFQLLLQYFTPQQMFVLLLVTLCIVGIVVIFALYVVGVIVSALPQILQNHDISLNIGKKKKPTQ